MKPAGDYIFLKSTDKPVSFLFIPDSAARKIRNYGTGVVIDRGPKAEVVDIGNEVTYNKDLGIEIELNDEKYVIVRPKWLLGIV